MRSIMMMVYPMGSVKLSHLSIWVVLLLSSLWEFSLRSEGTLIIRFTRTPAGRTRQRDALLRYTLTDENGSSPCRRSNCTFKCKLDDTVLNPCPVGVILMKNLSVNHEHTFSLNVTTSTGEHNSSSYSWFVDNVPPTASVIANASFTNAMNVSVNITFSELCPGRGGFRCITASDCDLIVNGPAEVIPSSLREFDGGLKYSILVALSNQTPYGRVVLDMARNFCTDLAGNAFERTANSSFVIRFDRRPVFVNLWTPIPDLQLDVNHVPRTIQATNKVEDLKIFLDFSDPIVNSTDDILSVLRPSTGFLVSIHRRSHGNRRFGFALKNLSSIATVTVKLNKNSLIGRTGTPVSDVAPVTFLYDSTRPKVRLSTISPGKTKAHNITVVIEFTEPVFNFDSSGVAIRGGRIARFKELSKTTYVLNVLVAIENVVSVLVPENRASDIAGNLNLASNQLQVRHYSTPAISVALYSFTTAGLLATSVAAGVLALSSATLAAAGALTSGTRSSIISDPSRNLLGMAGHLQVFAFTDWLSVSLPVEYHETTRGLRWLIPHAKLPWNKDEILSTTFDAQLVVDSPDMSTVKHKRSLLSAEVLYYHKRNQYSIVPTFNCSAFSTERWARTHCALKCSVSFVTGFGDQKMIPNKGTGKISSGLRMSPVTICNSALYKSEDIMHNPRRYRERKLGLNSTIYGPALNESEYISYFVNQNEMLSVAKLIRSEKKYTGWHDFEMNMFWLGVVGGGSIILHILILVFLKWRTKTSLRGALSIPRFELFLLILTLPCMCQASAFIIRGGTTAGIIVGVTLLAIPAAFLLSVFLFLSVAVFMGDLAQYKEIKHENEEIAWYSKIVAIFLGRNAVGKWFRNEGLPSSFLSRFGILFEDRKGPPKFVFVDGDNPRSMPKWTDSGTNGIGRMRAVNSDDDCEDTTVSTCQRVIGSARSAYLILDLIRRVAFGIIFGAYAWSDHSWSEVAIAFGFTAVQLLYLFILKPYIRKGVHVVESICLLCEAGVFAAGFVLIARGHPSDDHKGIGIFMLVLLFISFVSQLVNEWYALMNRLVRLAPSQQPSLKLGLKMLVRGILLPLIPHQHWSKFITPEPSQPKTGLVPVVPFSPEVEHERRATELSQIESPLSITEDVVPTYHPGSPCFVDPRTVSPAIIGNEGEEPASGEIRAESSPRTGQIRSQWGRTRSLEGKRSKGTKSDPKSSELKMLRELAKASFPGVKKDGDQTEMAGSLELAMVSPSSASREVIKQSTRSARRRHSYSDESSSDDDSDTYSLKDSPLQAPQTPSLDLKTGASSSLEKSSRQETMPSLV